MPKLSATIFRRLLRPRLSLRAMMLVVLVVGGGLGWYIASARRQAETVARIGRAGGWVMYDWQQHDGQWVEHAMGPPYPHWLIERLGQDFFCNVTAIHWSEEVQAWPEDDGDLLRRIGELHHLEVLVLDDNKNITDAKLARFSGLWRLRTLYLSKTHVTGPGLVHLKSMATLEDLQLDGLPIRDGDLANLSGLINLKVLHLPGEQLSDAGLAHPGSLMNLEELQIDRGNNPSAITTKGLAHLASLRKLIRLDILGSKVESLEPIRPLTRLKAIRIVDAALDDEGLAPLSGFGALQVLVLDGNPKITDAGLAHLAGLKELHSLLLEGTKITPVGVTALKVNCPGVDVRW